MQGPKDHTDEQALKVSNAGRGRGMSAKKYMELPLRFVL
jgi:hypothetical protein